MLFFYLIFLIAALYIVSKTLLPELTKPSLPKKTVLKPDPFVFIESNETYRKTEKLEILLAEKNKQISLLQNELRSFNVQARSFDKIKTLLDEEIHRLREQNRIFRSELGLPTVQHKENSIT